MLQSTIRQLLTAESGASVDATVRLLNKSSRKPSSISESTPILFPTTSSESMDNLPVDAILAVKLFLKCYKRTCSGSKVTM